MNLVVINDLHLGVHRSAGTTPVTAQSLREWGLEQYGNLLQAAAGRLGSEGHVVVNGDLTDRFDVALADALEIYTITAGFLRQHPGIRMSWALGNHDLSKDSSKLGTVAFIGELLGAQFDNFRLVSEPEFVQEGVFVIPHLVNQEAFDAALSAVPEGAKVVLLHCNFDNGFAAQADHSLNLNREQARQLTQRGCLVILGHEHQGRTAFGGKLIVSGNQFPTSIADCMSKGEAQVDGCKYMLHVTGERVEKVQTWDARRSFADVDWRQLHAVSGDLEFIRVSGQATAEESSEVVRAIAEMRKAHGAFVISNAVKIDAVDDGAEISASVEEIGKIDVIDLLKEFLTKEQAEKVNQLLEETHD